MKDLRELLLLWIQDQRPGNSAFWGHNAEYVERMEGYDEAFQEMEELLSLNEEQLEKRLAGYAERLAEIRSQKKSEA